MNISKLKKEYVFCYWPWFDEGKNKTIEDWKKQPGIFNELGEKYKAAGLKLAYHNHNIEFIETEKQIPFDILLSYLDPEYTTFQMDIWRVIKGGQDPRYFIKNHPGRFEVCHIKMAGILDGTESTRDFDYQHILKQAPTAEFKHFVLENEPEIENPFDFFSRSYTYIQSILSTI